MFLFGSSVEADLRAAEAGAKNSSQANQRMNRALTKWLGSPNQFRDPSSSSGPVQL